MEPVGNQVLRNVDGKKVDEEEKEMQGICGAPYFEEQNQQIMIITRYLNSEALR